MILLSLSDDEANHLLDHLKTANIIFNALVAIIGTAPEVAKEKHALEASVAHKIEEELVRNNSGT